jgi:hypothetical protein
MCAGAGSFEAAHITLTQGLHLGLHEDTAEQLAAALAQVKDPVGQIMPLSGSAQGGHEIAMAMAAHQG